MWISAFSSIDCSLSQAPAPLLWLMICRFDPSIWKIQSSRHRGRRQLVWAITTAVCPKHNNPEHETCFCTPPRAGGGLSRYIACVNEAGFFQVTSTSIASACKVCVSAGWSLHVGDNVWMLSSLCESQSLGFGHDPHLSSEKCALWFQIRHLPRLRILLSAPSQPPLVFNMIILDSPPLLAALSQFLLLHIVTKRSLSGGNSFKSPLLLPCPAHPGKPVVWVGSGLGY